MSTLSDDDYSSSSYYSLSYNKCNQCNKTIAAKNQQQQKSSSSYSIEQEQYSNDKKTDTKKHRPISQFTTRLFKCLFIVCHCRRRNNKRCTIEQICTCTNTEKPSKSSDSFTFIDEQQQPEQPWIVPSGYHKNMLSNSPDNRNQWIFRTGWTPQPDPLALIHSGWCNNCGSCVKKDLIQCSSCGIQPLITTRHVLGGIEEKKP